MRLSERLGRVAANVHSGGVLADIGCDHGFTSIYLVQQGQVRGAIAMDVNAGPLERAAAHVEQYGMAHRIQVRLSDGMDRLAPGEADTILISGLGGALMARILEQGRDVVAGAGELVLSPQSEIFLVRRKIHELGFAIVHEEMVEDHGKYYVIIRAVPGRESYGREEYFYGRRLIQEGDQVFRNYLQGELKRLEEVELHMSGNVLSPQGREKMKKCRQDKENIQGLLNKMERDVTVNSNSGTEDIGGSYEE